MFVTIGVGGEMAGVPEGNASPDPGLGMSTTAMKTEVGVACIVLSGLQLENNSVHKIRTKER
jgi:hypothetical protein